jgi:hypothetical protein
MIRVQVTDRLVADAQLLVDDPHQTLKDAGRYSDADLLIGSLGEIAVIDYCWNNDLLIFKNEGRSSDLKLYSGQTVEVKTQKVSTTPELHYRVNVASRTANSEKSDFYFFTHLQFVAGRPEAVWLLGGCSWDKFWRLSERHAEGSPMMRHYADGNEVANGRYFSCDTNILPISQLAPPSATLKHFQSLQQKEQTQ